MGVVASHEEASRLVVAKALGPCAATSEMHSAQPDIPNTEWSKTASNTYPFQVLSQQRDF